MTAPVPVAQVDPNESIWCTECEIHRATPYKPLCPVCADLKARELQEGR